MQADIKRNADSTVELTCEIPADEFESHRQAALKHVGKELEAPGFRKGHLPEKLVIEKVGEEQVLHNMAEHTLRAALPRLLKEHKIDAIGKPNVAITKIAAKNPLGFKLTTAVLPEITLPDYQALAKEHNAKPTAKINVEEKEIEQAIKEIQARAAQASDKGQKTPKASGKEKESEVSPPEITDEFVKTLGDFKNVADFKEKLTLQIKQSKERLEKDKRRAELIGAITDSMKTTLPDIVVDAELGKMLAQFKQDVERVGMKFADYLQQIKKTEEDLMKEWRPDAEKRAKTQLVLNKIAKKENLRADEKRVDAEVSHILSHYPEESGKKPNTDMVRLYVATMLTNEKVIEFLESQKEKEA